MFQEYVSNLKDIVENLYDFLANISDEICGRFYKLDILFISSQQIYLC